MNNIISSSTSRHQETDQHPSAWMESKQVSAEQSAHTVLPLSENEAKKRLRESFLAQQVAQENQELATIRAEIGTIIQDAQLGRTELTNSTQTAVEQLTPLAATSTREKIRQLFGDSTLTALSIFARKARQQAELTQKQTLSQNQTGELTVTDKILRFGNSTGEDDTNQKAA